MLALEQFFLCFLSQRCWKTNLRHEVFLLVYQKEDWSRKCAVHSTQIHFTSRRHVILIYLFSYDKLNLIGSYL